MRGWYADESGVELIVPLQSGNLDPISVLPIISQWEAIVTLVKKKIKMERPKREKLTREVALKRVKAFSKRKEKMIAAIREGKDRDLRS